MQLVVGGMDTIAAEMVMEFERLAAAGPLACGLTGGGAGMIILGALRTARVDWSRVSLFWTDERAVPPTHTDSGVGLVHRMLIARLKGQPGPRLFPMPATEPDLEHAAAEYDAQLAEALGGDGLDLAIVGIGEDGHVAGLFPRHAALAATSRVVAVADAPRPPVRRLTLSLPFLVRSHRVWIVAVGPRKLPLVQAAIGRTGGQTPFHQLARQARDVTIFTDQTVRR